MIILINLQALYIALGMSILSNIFKKKRVSIEPEIQFGRYSDSIKTDEQYKSWNLAIENFENQKYLQVYQHFLDFIASPVKNNVTYNQQNGKLTFSIQQGSKIIEGESDFKFFKAEAKIVSTSNPPISLLRDLLETNFDLKYARYAMDENGILCLRFDTYVEDGSPHKVYEALKELATEADKKDDVLIAKYPALKPVNNHHIRTVDKHEISTKYHFFIDAVQSALQVIDNGKLDAHLYPGGISYLLLDLIYKIDYLIKPEGNIQDTIIDLHTRYFQDSISSVHDKNKKMITAIRSFNEISYEDFAKEIYEVSATFGISKPEGPQQLSDIIDAQLNDFDWYYNNKYYKVAQAICGYAVGYSLYSFTLPDVLKDYLKLYYKMTENEYFTDLGFHCTFAKTDGTLIKSEIISSIKSLFQSYFNGKSDQLTRDLVFDDMAIFSKSYLLMIKKIVSMP
jgi:hypothetical protein